MTAPAWKIWTISGCGCGPVVVDEQHSLAVPHVHCPPIAVQPSRAAACQGGSPIDACLSILNQELRFRPMAES